MTINTPARYLPPTWRHNPQFVYCGPHSLFESPFRLYRGQKPDLNIFKDYFLNKVLTDPGFTSKVLALRGKTLVCPGHNCTVTQCHTRIIADWVNQYFSRDNDRLLALKTDDPDHYYDLRISDDFS